jgi:copper chaperone NosL
VGRLSLLLALGLVLGACDAVDADGPEVNYGRDICIECGMIIEDPRFAAVYRLDDGTEKKFDDLGGLLIHGREGGQLHLGTIRVWVSDFEHETLIDAESAFYVPTLGVASPMGHGILAFAEESRAHAVATDLGGEVIEWKDVIELPVNDGLVGDHHMSDAGHDHEGG